jgi:hypothetical protein
VIQEPPDVVKELEMLREQWPDLVEKCLILQPLLKRDLRDSWPMHVSDTTLTIGFDPEFSGIMDEVKMLDHGGLHTLFSKLLERSVRIDYQVMTQSVSWSHHAPDAETVKETGQTFSVDSAGNNPDEWIKNESVRQVLEIFHGDILEIQR